MACVVAVAALVLMPTGPIGANETAGRPTHLHQGTCDNVGKMAFALTGVGAEVTLDGLPIPSPHAAGPETALPVQISVTKIEAAVSDLVDGGHALVVYEKDEAMDRVVACGDIGGVMTTQMAGMVMLGDELIVGLAERDDSGFAGIALLRAEGGAETTVTIYLAQGLSGTALSTPVSD
jgi:hypothetical protein